MEPKQIKGGVLIIGSLLWQDGSTNEPWDHVRSNWRKQYIDENNPIKVKVPIRYGRYSYNTPLPIKINKVGMGYPLTILGHSNFTNELYTMVLSKAYDTSEKLGTAFVYPLKQDIFTLDDVKANVKALSKAEGIYINDTTYFRKKWGAISVWINQNRDSDLKYEIINLFQNKIANPDFLEKFEGFKGDPSSILNEDGTLGLLDIPTVDPSQQQLIDNLDFILTAVTVPKNKNEEVKKYPDFDQIGKFAQQDVRRYFQNNHKNEIVTFDDKKINEKYRLV